MKANCECYYSLRGLELYDEEYLPPFICTKIIKKIQPCTILEDSRFFKSSAWTSIYLFLVKLWIPIINWKTSVKQLLRVLHLNLYEQDTLHYTWWLNPTAAIVNKNSTKLLKQDVRVLLQEWRVLFARALLSRGQNHALQRSFPIVYQYLTFNASVDLTFTPIFHIGFCS